MTQAQAVVDYIQKYGSITRFDAFNHLMILNLTSVISQIRQGRGGIDKPTEIVTEKVPVLSDLYGKTDYAVYKLAK